uniref:RBR-type E3 ubiquitin transferase n=1 Tax=Aplanochytrium stocchinoi TaxID=215587 RepID=A0A7S3LNL0_9STRA|mmetsp:Transcript_8987/g.10460  ORF Transcript_8987/g.10460 Transcript_8987/m.10460 type:complete len:440 (+) Transcript_8987:300-1619(+)
MESVNLILEDIASAASQGNIETSVLQLGRLPSAVIIPSTGDDMLTEAKKIFDQLTEYADMVLFRLCELYPDLPQEHASYLLWKHGGSFENTIHYLIENSHHDSDVESKHYYYDDDSNGPPPLASANTLESDSDGCRSDSSCDIFKITETKDDFVLDPSNIKTDSGCMICFSNVNVVENHDHKIYSYENAALGCGHVICWNCCKQYLKYRIKDGKIDRNQLTCPIPDCHRQYNLYRVFMVCDIKTVEKLIRFRVEKAFTQNPFGRWCCNKDCESLIIANPKERLVVCTQCKQKLCFKCSQPYHRGPCLRIRMPSIKRLAHTKWKLINKAKKCPQCQYMIVKSHGCNHMTCAKCGFEFCWLCRKAYTASHFDSPLSCSSSRSFNVWGPNRPVRLVTKTVGGAVLVSVGVATIVVASPYLVWKNKGKIKKSIKGSFSLSTRS